jgi:hypothetical protein
VPGRSLFNPYLGPQGAMLIGQSEYAERLMRALALKGDLPQYIAPVADLSYTQEDFTRFDWCWLRRETRWSVGGTGVAGVGVFSIFAFAAQSAVGRQTLASVDKIIVSNPSAATISVNFGLTMAGVGGVALTRFGQMLDDRQFQAAQSGFAAGTGQNAASPAPAQCFLFSIPAGGSFDLPVCPLLMTNADNGVFGSAFVIVPTVVNVGMQVGMTWRERQLSDSELR